MTILFLSLSNLHSIKDRGIYTDLLREFISHGDEVYILTPIEDRGSGQSEEIKEDYCTIIRVPTGRVQKTNIIRKGINTLLIGSRFKNSIKKNFKNTVFDLILYPTPPITLVSSVKYVKKRDHAQTYLLLKDIFPQNSVDIGMMSKKGIRGFIFKYFRRREKQLYAISDTIGCMSQANCDYLLRNNSFISAENVEVCPNSVDPIDMSVGSEEKASLRSKYGIPQDKTVFIYGGNLGRPQGIPFILECLASQKENQDVLFLIVGDGTEFNKLKDYVLNSKQENVKLMSRLPKDDYDRMVGSCDVGLIFLDHRFTIPNFPSRLLAYMQAKIPVLAVTDPNTDFGDVIVNGEFGWWCESNDVIRFSQLVSEISAQNLKDMGEKAFSYLKSHYSVADAYQKIMKRCGGE